jgi:adenylate cyclase
MIRNSGITFQELFNWAFGLIGMIPYLLAVYVLVGANVNITTTLLVMALAAFCSHLLGLLLLRKQGDNLRALSRRTVQIVDSKSFEQIDFPEELPAELFDLARSFNTVLSNMERTRASYREITSKILLYAKDIDKYQKKLADEATIRTGLSRYVGQNVLEHIMRDEMHLPLQTVNREVTILFADIRSFTTLSEHMPPKQVITMLNEYFDAMVDIIFEHEGVLDKFIGDELMALFGLVGSPENGPANAVRAGLAMQEQLARMMAVRGSLGWPVFKVGIGINTGEVVVGNVGSKNRMDYTVIGDAVNIAARFEQSAEGGKVVIGETTKLRCPPSLKAEPMGSVQVRNRIDPVSCYEVISLPR